MKHEIIAKSKKDGLEEEMRRLFNSFSQMRHRAMLYAVNLWHPSTDVYETEDKLVILCELAGIDKDNICLKIENDIINISGSRPEMSVGKAAVFHNMEINYGPFERNIKIPRKFIGSEPVANFSSGILKIYISIKPHNTNENFEIEIE